MKVGVYQTDPVLLDVKTNLASTIEKIEAAKAEGVDLVVFPELSLTGYFVRERYHEAALRMDSPEIKQLAGGDQRDGGRRRVHRRIPGHEFLQFGAGGRGR